MKKPSLMFLTEQELQAKIVARRVEDGYLMSKLSIADQNFIPVNHQIRVPPPQPRNSRIRFPAK